MFQRVAALVLLVLGMGTIILGLIIGSSPDPVSYQHSSQEHIAHFITTRNGMAYLQMMGDPTIYAVDIRLFSPKINSYRLFTQGYQQIGVVYDKNQIIDVHAQDKSTRAYIRGQGYRSVSITFSNDTGAQQTFDTEEYKQHPDDYDLDYWPIGLPVIGIGILLISASIGLFSLKEGSAFSLHVTLDGLLA